MYYVSASALETCSRISLATSAACVALIEWVAPGTVPRQALGCGSHFVEAHEPRVARHVGRDYCGQPASDTIWLLLLHEPIRPFARHLVR
jgi:hypothetical protein